MGKHDFNENTAKKTDKKSFLASIFKTQAWRSKLSWKIAATVFLAIIFIQVLLLTAFTQEYKETILQSLEDSAEAAISPALSKALEGGASDSIITVKEIEDILKYTDIAGISVYDKKLELISFHGDETTLIPKETKTPEKTISYLYPEKDFYEVIFNARTPEPSVGPNTYHTYEHSDKQHYDHPYYTVVKIHSLEQFSELNEHLKTALLVILAVSALITNILMMALSKWLLGPIMILRKNLLNAAKSPEKPEIIKTGVVADDDLGMVISIANNLIVQNSFNLNRLKSQAEDKIHRLAYFDPLTSLPNRTYFIEKVEGHIKDRRFDRHFKMAVLSIDIDHFKDINDTMGHEIGDRILEAVGKRLVKSLPDETLVSRASADEFIAMTSLDIYTPDSSTLVENIFNSMKEPISVMEERFQVRVSVGVAHYPQDGSEAKQLIKNSDIALNRAKEEGRDTARYYSEEFDEAIQKRFQMLRDLRIAMEKDQLDLYYHPQFDLKTGKMIGVEALLRWWKPDEDDEKGGHFISPADFIPVAEQSGLIVPIGDFVLKKACVDNKRWQEQGLPPFRVAVNISGVQFHRCDIVKLTRDTLKETGLDPKWLELEVT